CLLEPFDGGKCLSVCDDFLLPKKSDSVCHKAEICESSETAAASSASLGTASDFNQWLMLRNASASGSQTSFDWTLVGCGSAPPIVEGASAVDDDDATGAGSLIVESAANV